MHLLTSRSTLCSLLLFLLATNIGTALAQHSPYPTTSASELQAIGYLPPWSSGGSNIDNNDNDNDRHQHQPSKRARSRTKGVYVCNREKYRGDCWWAAARGDECQNWGDIRSMGPENGLACDLFEGEDCRGKMAVRFVTWPGIEKTPGPGLRSWKCGSH